MFVNHFLNKNHKKFGIVFFVKPKSGVVEFLRLDSKVRVYSCLSKATDAIAY